MGRARVYLVILATCFFATASWADTLQFTGTATNTTLTIKDSAYPNGVTGYIDPYLGKLNGTPITMFCVDPNHEVNINDIWNVYITSAPTSDWTHTRLNDATTYGEMAYLASQMLATNNATTRQELQTVIWWLADNTLVATVPGGVNVTDWNNAIAGYKTAAASNVMTGGFEILSDTSGAKQEYLVLTPEPGSILLLTSGIAGLFGFRRRKLCR